MFKSGKAKVTRLLGDAHFLEMVKGSGVFFFTKLLGILALYLFSWYLSVNLKAEAYGRFAYLFTIVNVITVFTIFGFDAVLIKYFSAFAKENNYGKIKSIYLQTIKISLPLAILLSSIIFIGSFYIEHLEAWQLQLRAVALIIPAFTIFQINNAAISGLKKMKAYSVFKNIYLIPITFLVTFIISFHFLSPSYAIIALAITVNLGLVLNTLYLLKKIKFFNTHSETALENRTLFKVALPMLFTTATSLLITSVDILMLGFFKSTFEVGIYDIAIKISLIAAIALLGINAIATPKFSEFHSVGDKASLRKIIRWSSKFIFWSTVPILCLIFLFPKQLLSLFGEEFQQASTALVILAFGQFISSLSGSVGNILKMTDNQIIFQNIMILATLLNIILNFILIPSYSIVGAAIATAGSMIFYNLLGVLYVWRKLKIKSFYLPLIKF